MIWILTDVDWLPTAKRVDSHLAELGHNTQIFDSAMLEDLSVVIRGASLRVFHAGSELALPSAVIVFRLPVPSFEASATISTDARNFVQQQWSTLLRGLLLALEHRKIPLFNPSPTVLRDEKTHQLVLAHEAGFATPLTVQSATGAVLRASWSIAELLAVKQFRPVVERSEDGPAGWVKTLAFDQQTISDGLDQSDVKSPSVVQPLVDAPFEHRVVVVGDQVFAARTARRGDNAVDVRTMPVTEAEVTPSNLPADISAAAMRLVRAAGAEFATIDVLETADNGYVFLDLNCGGHFLWVEQLCGWPITEAIAEHVANRVRSTACVSR